MLNHKLGKGFDCFDAYQQLQQQDQSIEEKQSSLNNDIYIDTFSQNLNNYFQELDQEDDFDKCFNLVELDNNDDFLIQNNKNNNTNNVDLPIENIDNEQQNTLDLLKSAALLLKNQLKNLDDFESSFECIQQEKRKKKFDDNNKAINKFDEYVIETTASKLASSSIKKSNKSLNIFKFIFIRIGFFGVN